MAYTLTIASCTASADPPGYAITFTGTWDNGKTYTSRPAFVSADDYAGKSDSDIAALAWKAGPNAEMAAADAAISKSFALVGTIWTPPKE